LVKAVGQKMKQRRSQQAGGSKTSSKTTKQSPEKGLFERLNPFRAGQNLRKTIDSALTSINLPNEKKTLYYLDDRLQGYKSSSGGAMITERNPLLDRLDQDDFAPEVLVIGATGEIGSLVVRRLLLEGNCRVRVLVRDLYTKTLNLLGTGVTYCQGDLSNLDSLEYALTDVDKIVMCSTAPRPDEEDFQEKFQSFMKENLESDANDVEEGQTDVPKDTVKSLQDKIGDTDVESDTEWENLASVLEVRARLAEQIDCIGVQNVVRAYQDVRHADYGTSQAAKRSLFKFQDRPEDFNLFSIDDGDDDGDAGDDQRVSAEPPSLASFSYDEEDDEDDDEYYDYEDDIYEDEMGLEERRDESVKTQSQWIRNQFEHGVFVGRVPKQSAGSVVGGEASIISSRLRSRDDPENGIDLSGDFAGFICRLCSDGGKYEAFVRTREYYDNGVEYVCEFTTETKPMIGKNKSSNKFVTVRLPFEKFKPVVSKSGKSSDLSTVPPFRGGDVRNIGFRYRSASNPLRAQLEPGEWSGFYLALCYIKLYRAQLEPEFVYVSDARIPPVVRNGMVNKEARQLITASTDSDTESGPGGEGVVRIFDEATLKTVTDVKSGRSPEETYYKYVGEEIIKNSGLSYAIIRVADYNESPSSEASTIDLKSTNEDLTPVSRSELAQVCVSALLDPEALNKSFYISKKKGGSAADEDISSKFAALPRDEIP